MKFLFFEQIRQVKKAICTHFLTKRTVKENKLITFLNSSIRRRIVIKIWYCSHANQNEGTVRVQSFFEAV